MIGICCSGDGSTRPEASQARSLGGLSQQRTLTEGGREFCVQYVRCVHGATEPTAFSVYLCCILKSRRKGDIYTYIYIYYVTARKSQNFCTRLKFVASPIAVCCLLRLPSSNLSACSSGFVCLCSLCGKLNSVAFCSMLLS